MPTILNEFWASLGFLGLTLVGATGLAYWLFRTFSDKWLSQRFNKQLEDHKHSQQRELETLKFEINTLMDRKVKLHKFEFEVLPKLWELLNLAYGEVAGFVSPLQYHADLDRMNPAELSEFLEKAEIAQWQKDELKEGRDKTNRYAKMAFWVRYNKVNSQYHEFNKYFIVNGIFLSDDLKSQVSELRGILSDAMLEKRLEEEHPNPRPGRFEHSEKVRKEGRELLDQIEAKVRAVLWQTEPAKHENASSQTDAGKS